MTTAVTEAARVISPLSTSISNGIMRSINYAIESISKSSHQKTIDQLAYALKLEYPKESDEYVMNLAIEMYKDR